MADKFDELAAKAPKKGDEVPVGPDSDMKALMDMADEILAESPPPEEGAPAEGAPAEEAPMDEAPAEEAPAGDAAGGEVVLEPIEKMLMENNPELSTEEATKQAGDLWNAAGMRDDLASLTVEELVAKIKEDSNLLMELKKLAAQGEAMAAESMGAPEGAPEGAPMGGPPMGGMMPPGM
tara:strand:+ start:2038 stop:2574 length:537 start_codon:yes stop_codon:yes gene_type:complete